jgi:predicted dehydrogenase
MQAKYNWGILATGGIAKKFASDLKLLSNAKLQAVASRNIERAKEFSEIYGAKKYYGSYEELAADPEVDIVYIASPHMRHYADALLCMENKKHVLCEKPVAINTRQFKIMADTAEKNGVFFMEALWTRFIPSFNKFTSLIDNGSVGDIRLIESDFCFNAPYDVTGRLFNPLMGGGSLLDIGLYPVFLALEIAGLPLDIKAMASIDQTGVDSSCSMIFSHDKGILSVLFSSLTSQGRTESIIHGSKGMLRLNRFWHIPTSLDLLPDNKEIIHFDFPEPGFGYHYEAEEVMKCLDNGLKESPKFSLRKSLDLIGTLDTIRDITGIRYPAEIEKT